MIDLNVADQQHWSQILADNRSVKQDGSGALRPQTGFQVLRWNLLFRIYEANTSGCSEIHPLDRKS